jgi:cell division GTPase FtsZ
MAVEFEEIEPPRSVEKEDREFEELLNAKMEEDTMTVMAVEQKDRSFNMGVVGLGQAGNKIAKEFYDRGYPVILINTALQDLKLVEVPERHKLFLDSTLGGAAKDLDLGAGAVEEYSEAIVDMLKESFEPCEVLVLVVSGGGGTGSGGAPKMVELMSQLGKPVMVMYVLPMSSEDTLSKHNAITTLARLADLSKSGAINSLFVVDNAKIECMFPNKSMADFWKCANSAIVEPLHLFNKLSSQPSQYVSLDPMDLGKVLLASGCALYGMTKVDNYLDNEGAVAEAMINNLENGLLASDFDLGEANTAGVIIVGSKDTLQKIPAAYLEFGFAMVNKLSKDSLRLFRGIYEVETGDSSLYVYSVFSGLGLPKKRIDELKEDAEKHMKALEDKDNNKANMNIDLGGKTKATSTADQMYNKIKNKNSPMGKLMSGKRVQDLRRK